MAAMPIIWPRFSTHHLESVTLTTRLPISAAPTVNRTPRSSIHCHSSVMVPTMNRATPAIVTPITIIARPP